jgi:hypothetical protein
VILAHWIRRAGQGGVECYLHTAAGCVLQGWAPSAAELRCAIERRLTLTAEMQAARARVRETAA